MQETSPGPRAGKAEWRRWFRGILAGIADPDGQSASICQQIHDRLTKQPTSCVATFAPLPDEPSLLKLIVECPHHRWVFPRVAGDRLAFHQVDRLDQLTSGAFGIAEPSPDLPIIPTIDIDTFFCPGLGFDHHGIRLGRGKGYYDRALACAKPNARRIGIAFREQIAERLPADTHDVPMNLILSGSGIPIHPVGISNSDPLGNRKGE